MRNSNARFALPFGISLGVHLAAAAALLFAHEGEPRIQQDVYRIKLNAASEGVRSQGVIAKPEVKEAPKAPAAAKPIARTTPDQVKVASVRNNATNKSANSSGAKPQSVKAAPAGTKPPATSKPPATTDAHSLIDGKGVNTADLVFDGLDFPNQAYLDNIIDLIAMNFEPKSAYNQTAEFTFVVSRNGCTDKVKLSKSSRISDLDLSARVAIIKASANCAFGPLPASWTNDILDVRFRFDPKIIRK